MAKKGRGISPRATKKKATARKGGATRSTSRTAAKAKTASRTAVRKVARKPARPASRPAARPATRKPAPKLAPKPVPTASRSRSHAAQVAAPPPSPAPPPPPRKPGFYEAVAIYERGVQALQRHDFQVAAEQFRQVIQRYPEERELLERANLFLRVCERETTRQAAPPPATDHVYAATVAINSGDHGTALTHLQRALSANDEDDHAHYIMAVALTAAGRRNEAIEHLRRSVALNAGNRTQARQDPDLDLLRRHPEFQSAIDTPAAPSRKAAGARSR